MRIGGLLAAAVIVGYTGFELHAIGKNKYRTEKDFVFQQFVGADEAVKLCGNDQQPGLATFSRNLATVRTRAVAHISTQQPALTHEEVALEADRLDLNTRQEVGQLVAEVGCEDIEVWKLLKRFENLSRLNLP